MVAYNQTNLGRVYVSAQSDYETAVAAATVVSSGMPLEAAFYAPPTTREVFERAAMKGGFYDIPPIEGSKHGGTFSISMPLHGYSSSLPTANPATHPEYLFIKAVLGGGITSNYFAGDVVASGSDADTIKVSASPMEEYRVGSGIGILSGDGSSYGTGFIESLSEPAVTVELRVPMSFSTVTDSSTAYGSNTAYLSTDVTSAFTFVTRSRTNNSQLQLVGCVPTSVTISMGPKAQMMCDVDFICNGVNASAASSALTDFDFTYPVMPAPIGSAAARLCYLSGSSAVDMDVENFAITMSQTLTPQLGHGATSGVRDLMVTDRDVSMSFGSILGSVNPYDSSPDGIPQVDLENTTANLAKSVQFTIDGGNPGNSFGCILLSPVNVNPPELSDSNGVLVSNYTLKPGNYSGDTVDASDLAGNSDFRVAFV